VVSALAVARARKVENENSGWICLEIRYSRVEGHIVKKIYAAAKSLVRVQKIDNCILISIGEHTELIAPPIAHEFDGSCQNGIDELKPAFSPAEQKLARAQVGKDRLV
jgi:hypothetical protein